MIDLLIYILAIIAAVIVLYILFRIFKFIISIVLIAAFLFVAFVTNPTVEIHEEAVRQKAEAENISMKKKTVETDNFYVFSLTKVVSDSEKKLVGAGAFTKVLIFRNP